MAIKTIRIPDETLQKYQEMHPQNPSLAIEQQLERYKDISYKDRSLIFDPETRKELERLFMKPIESPQEFLAWVKRLIVADVGGIEIPLTDGQRKRLEAESRYSGHPLQQYIKVKIENAIRNGIGA